MDPISDFSTPLYFSPCMHWHITTVLVGRRCFVRGETWDNIEEELLCLDCGDYVTEAEVRARWNGKEWAGDLESSEEADYGDL